MVNSKKIFIHIGFPRAGSTSLQKNLFNRHTDINYLGLHARGYNENYREFYNNIVKLDNASYPGGKTKELFEKNINPKIEADKANVFSLEDIANSWYLNNPKKAGRLKNFFPDAKIIIILRNQPENICSLYDHEYFGRLCDTKNEYRLGPLGPGTGSEILDLDQWLKASFQEMEKSYLIGLNYYEIVKVYTELFGRENVGIFLFEELAGDLDLFAGKLADFMGIDFKQIKELLSQPILNSSVTVKYISLLKFKKRFLPFLNVQKIMLPAIRKLLLGFLQTGKSKKSELNEYWRKKLSKLYGDSNRKLEAEFKLGITKYKYPL